MPVASAKAESFANRLMRSLRRPGTAEPTWPSIDWKCGLHLADKGQDRAGAEHIEVAAAHLHHGDGERRLDKNGTMSRHSSFVPTGS
jgi:hypothetical protein